MTYAQVEEAVATLEAEGLRVSAAALIQRIGGSKRDVLAHLRQLRGTERRVLVSTEPALVPAAAPAAALAGDPEPMLVSPQCAPVVRYRVTSARFFRTSLRSGLVHMAQGIILDDVTPDELAAFPDIFARVED